MSPMSNLKSSNSDLVLSMIYDTTIKIFITVLFSQGKDEVCFLRYVSVCGGSDILVSELNIVSNQL